MSSVSEDGGSTGGTGGDDGEGGVDGWVGDGGGDDLGEDAGGGGGGDGEFGGEKEGGCGDVRGGEIGGDGGYGGIGTKLVDVIGRVILVIVVRPNSICARVLLLASSFALAITASRLTVPIVVMFTVATTLPEVNVTSTLPAVKPNVDITLD